jgi:SAM-dependent methyltransferase
MANVALRFGQNAVVVVSTRSVRRRLARVARRLHWSAIELSSSARAPEPPPGRLPLNCLASDAPWFNPEWRMVGRLLGLSQDEGWYHRKAFEWTHCVYGLEQLGVLGPDTDALGVGAGHECVLYYLANRTRLTVATDLYSGAFVDAHAAEAAPDFLANPAKYAPFPYHEDRLLALPADGCVLPFRDGSFDVVYSLSSIEHFGGHDRAAESMREMSRVLRPGGIACVATEFVLSGGSHPEYFTAEDFNRWIIGSCDLVPIEPLDLTPPPDRYMRDPIRLPEEVFKTPHIVISAGDFVWTSVVVFMRKPTRRDLASWSGRRVVGAVRRRLAKDAAAGFV